VYAGKSDEVLHRTRTDDPPPLPSASFVLYEAVAAGLIDRRDLVTRSEMRDAFHRDPRGRSSARGQPRRGSS
jgi:hypothetical protein